MVTNTKRTMMEKFLDRTAGETFSEGRLSTRMNDAGNVELVAYGWLKVAEYNESREAVTVFTGHKSIGSVTVSRYLNDVVTRANERGRDVVLSGESPTVATPNAGVRFIGNYVSFDGTRSAVESKAVQSVRESLSHVA